MLAETRWIAATNGEWVDAAMWSDGVPCSAGTPMALAKAVLPAYTGQRYTVDVSAARHPLGGLRLEPGTKIKMARKTILDFKPDPDAACPARQTTTSTTTTTTTTTTTIYDPANIDCVETASPCTAACELAAARVHTVQVQPVAAGRACVGATDCQPGDGACPGGDGDTSVGIGDVGTGSTDRGGDIVDVGAATDAFRAAASSSGGIVISDGDNDYRASDVASGDDGDSFYVTFPTLNFADITAGLEELLETSLLEQAETVLGFPPKRFAFAPGGEDGGGTVVTIYVVEPTVEPPAPPNSPAGIIVGVVLAILFILLGVFLFATERGAALRGSCAGDGTEGQLPKSVSDAAKSADESRAVENPLYAGAAGAAGADGGSRVVGNPTYDTPDAIEGYLHIQAEDAAV